MNITIKNIHTPADINECLAIRRKVFIEGMNVPVEREVDGLDNVADHFLARLGDLSIGTARVVYIDGKAKIERVAILPEHQHKGYGKILILHMIDFIKKQQTTEQVILASQVYAINFYEKLGFTVASDEFEDAGIPHKYMSLKVN